MSKKDMGADIFKDWHLRKEITIGQILTMALVIASLLAWGQSVQNSIDSNKKEIVRLEQKHDLSLSAIIDRMNRTDSLVNTRLADIQQSLRRIEDRLNDND